MVANQLKNLPVVGSLYVYLRGLQQERFAKRTLRNYERKAKALGIASPDVSNLENKLRLRLADRAKNRWPKAKGRLHLFLAYYVSSWEAILPKALAPLGKVSAFNWREHGFNDRTEDWLKHRDQMNQAMLRAFEQANASEQVDAVVGYLSGNNTAPETLQTLAREGAAIFNFCWDDKLFFPGVMVGGRYNSPAAIAHAVDLNLTNAPESVIKYAVHDGLAMFWPEAAHPDIHRPCDVLFEFDVSFVGACYGWRPRFIQRLRRRGIKVECFGKGWPNGSLSDEEMVRLYSRSRINLGFAGIGHSRRLMCLKNRDFEVPMSGGLYLTQDNPELKRVYDVGREIVTFTDEQDCAQKIRSLLDDPGRAAAIRAAGRARALREHTYERRWEKVFRFAGLMSNGGSPSV
jgi:hypothetical protein